MPERPLQFLSSKYDEEVLEGLNKYNLDLDISLRTISKKVVDEVHANGHKINCWTVDDKEFAEKLVEWGVDFITTNILE